MNEIALLLEYLKIVESKLSDLMRDVRNIHNRLEDTQDPPTPSQPNYGHQFFQSLRAEENTGDAAPAAKKGAEK
jgi:hypothetical protein